MKITENDVKKAIKAYLEFNRWTVFRINNTGIYNAKRKQYIFHGKAGLSDLIAIKKPYILFIETKAPGKRMSEEQEKFIQMVNLCDKPIGFCADSFESFEKEMKKLINNGGSSHESSICKI